MKNDRGTVWIENNKFFLGRDGILYETMVGDINNETVKKAEETMNRFLDMIDGKLNIFVDINKVGVASRDARMFGKNAINNERIGKIAIFGMNPVARVNASFFMNITQKNDIKFFKIKKEAIEWLNK